MLTKEVTFEDFEGKEVTRTFHFNLTKFEVLEINLIDDINEIMAATDMGRLLPAIKRIFHAAVGKRVKNEFVKSEQYSDSFIASDAFSTIMLEMIESDDPAAAAEAFIRGCLPTSVRLEIAKEAQK